MTDGRFFLGKEVSLQDGVLKDELYLYKANDLTTHAMVFGMTGSGKTGLCLDLLEEAMDEGIPIIAIDPKGDLANLALMFPEFSPADFAPWVSPVEAARKGKSTEEYAGDVAEKWKKGTASWGIDSARMQAIKDKADVRIYTPGSSAGLSISILEGFQMPGKSFAEDEEGMTEKIRNSVSALLALLDIDNDPLKSKPHILISNIIEHYWRMGRGLSIEELILNVQKPPIKKLGVFEIDSIINKKERSELAFEINNVIASPGFRFWSSGTPLSAQALYGGDGAGGKTPVNIFSIAHLPENERMFFVTLLLNEIVYWIRRQSGAGNLKYLLYMDEIFGYLPPYPLNPPSKNALLVLLKQARAFGLGVMLATQNPKDIDYKALTNMGTWFVGKLQAEGDRERVLEGLAGMRMESGEDVDGAELREMIALLGSRRFLVKNIHDEGLKAFQTRWAMSYLAGPMTREQIKTLVKPIQQEGDAASPGAAPRQSRAPFQQGVQPVAGQQAGGYPTADGGPPVDSSQGPVPTILPYAPQTEAPLRHVFFNGDGTGRYYSPRLYMDGEVVFDENHLGLYIRKQFYVKAPFGVIINWREADISEQPVGHTDIPASGAMGYEPLGLDLKYSVLRSFQKAFRDFLFSNLTLELFINRELNLVSELDESEATFKQRCREVVERMIDREVDKVKDEFSRKIKRLEDRIHQEKLKLEGFQKDRRSRQTEEYISAGESVLGFLLGSKSRRGFSTAARKRRSTTSAAGKVKRGQAKLEQLEEDLVYFQENLEDKVAEIEDNFYDKADEVKPFEVRLEKNDIIVSNMAICWQLV